MQQCEHETLWLRQVVVGCRKVHEVWEPALNLEVTLSADEIDMSERERELVSDPKTFGQSYLVRGHAKGRA